MKDDLMKKTQKRWIINIALLVALIGVTVYLFLREYDFYETIAYLGKINALYFCGAALMVLLFLGLEGVAYKILLKMLGRRISSLSAFAYGCIDFYFSAITPSAAGGQPFVGYYMKRSGIPLSQGTIAILIHTVFYKTVLIIYGILAFFIAPHIIFDTEPLLTIGIFIGIGITLSITALCVFAIFSKSAIYKVSSWFIKVAGKLKIIKDADDKQKKLIETIKDYKNCAVLISKNKLVAFRAFIFVFLQRSAIFGVSYFAYKSFGLSEFGLFEILVLQAILSFAVDSLPMPGGVGASEIAFIAIYTSVYTEQYMAPALLFTRGMTYYFCVVVSGTVTLINHIRLIGKKKD